MSNIHKGIKSIVHYLFILIVYGFYDKQVKAADFFNLKGGKSCGQFYNDEISVTFGGLLRV